MIPKPNMAKIAKAEDQTTAAVTEMLKGPMWMIEQILRKHETAVIEVMREQQEKIERLIKVSEDIAYHNQQLRDAIERMRVAGDKFEFQCAFELAKDVAALAKLGADKTGEVS